MPLSRRKCLSIGFRFTPLALIRIAIDIIGTGDHQTTERKFGLSRQMLKVCLELGFPV